VPESNRCATLRVLPGLLLCFAVLAGVLHADVVVLKSGRAYVGVIERRTSSSVYLFDGNLRRVVGQGDIKQITRERPDTSWVLVGDLMLAQRDWQAAGEAYTKALELTDQPDPVLRRLERLRVARYLLPGGKEAEALLAVGKFEEAAKALHDVTLRARDLAQQRHWTERLSRAYVGLASQRANAGATEVEPYLAYALSLAPASGSAHAALGERLESLGFTEAARVEYLLALDLDPLTTRARTRLEARGESWTYDRDEVNRSGAVSWANQQPLFSLDPDPPLTTDSLAAAIRRRFEQQPVERTGLLLGAMVYEPTAALAYRGALPYPGFEDMVDDIREETAEAEGQTKYDIGFVRSAIRFRIDPRFMRAIARVRSDYRPGFKSPKGARGLVPLTRVQWAVASDAAGVDWDFETVATEPEKNIDLACRYVEWLRRDALRPYVGNALDRLERVHDNL
jgi:tetratricopeptide (TPR) repeat protein